MCDTTTTATDTAVGCSCASTDTTATATATGTAGGCSCASTDTTAHASGAEQDTTALTTTTYSVTGMTCGHCVSAVSTEIGTLAGVRGVAVDLPTGAVTVTSTAPLGEADVAAAVDEAGYTLTRSDGGSAG